MEGLNEIYKVLDLFKIDHTQYKEKVKIYERALRDIMQDSSIFDSVHGIAINALVKAKMFEDELRKNKNV